VKLRFTRHARHRMRPVESGHEARLQAVLEVGRASRELSRGLVSALGWLPCQHAETSIQQLLTAESSNLRRIGIAAYAVQRRDSGYPLTVPFPVMIHG
jgi:hypothetical protein